jgi:hypothetical protein
VEDPLHSEFSGARAEVRQGQPGDEVPSLHVRSAAPAANTRRSRGGQRTGETESQTASHAASDCATPIRPRNRDSSHSNSASVIPAARRATPPAWLAARSALAAAQREHHGALTEPGSEATLPAGERIAVIR